MVRDADTKARLGAWYREGWSAYRGHQEKGLESLPAEQAERARRTLDAGSHLAEHFAETPAVLVFCFDPSGLAVTDAALDRVSVVGGGSIYPAVQNTLLACRAEGLGCTLTTLLCTREPEVKALLGIPEGWGTAGFVPIGYPVGRGHGPLRRRGVEDVAFADRWGQGLD